MEKGNSQANANHDKETAKDETNDIPVCNYAPEWSEHARYDRADEPCDDGRMGGRPCAEDEDCPVTDEKMPD